MKKKIATFILMIFSALCVLTGCNLFNKDTSMSLNSIVAMSGKYEITREELINAYNNGGYYYASYYGYSQEEALQKTIDELLDQKYLLDYIDSQEEYKLTSEDYNEVVANTWEYLDSALDSYLESIKESLGIEDSTTDAEEEDSDDPEFDVRASYTSKFEIIDGKIVYIESDDTKETHFDRTFESEKDAEEYALDYYYKSYYLDHIDTNDKDLKTRTWKSFVSGLKSSQSSYKYSDMSDEAVVTRQIKKIFSSNLDSQKISKFQERVQDHSGLKYNEDLKAYTPLESTLENIIKKYKEKYKSNVTLYNSLKDKSSSSAYYEALSNTKYRDNFVYYGKGEETMITCTHILVKLSDEQTSAISSLKDKYTGEAYESVKSSLESATNTKAYERSLETGEVIDEEGISVADLYNKISNDLKNVNDLQERLDIFNDYLYAYNVDTGIINAKYDYVVGTENSQMVTTFTDAVRDLYKNGKPGDITWVYESNDSYSGYHIIMYTGTLTNIFETEEELNALTVDNVYNKLGKAKTSLTYKETLFEYFYDAVVSDNYSTIKASIVESQKNGNATSYNKGNYSDLY